MKYREVALFDYIFHNGKNMQNQHIEINYTYIMIRDHKCYQQACMFGYLLYELFDQIVFFKKNDLPLWTLTAIEIALSLKIGSGNFVGWIYSKM